MDRSVKLLLTLLVLLSGLAAVPAQAGSRAEGASGFEQVQPFSDSGAATIAGPTAGERTAPRPSRDQRAGGRRQPGQVAAPSPVREGDRALE